MDQKSAKKIAGAVAAGQIVIAAFEGEKLICFSVLHKESLVAGTIAMYKDTYPDAQIKRK